MKTWALLFVREINTLYYERARAKPEGIKLIYRNVDC